MKMPRWRANEIILNSLKGLDLDPGDREFVDHHLRQKNPGKMSHLQDDLLRNILAANLGQLDASKLSHRDYAFIVGDLIERLPRAVAEKLGLFS